MLVRDLITERQNVNEIAVAIPLAPILNNLLMAGGTALAAYITSKTLEQAEIKFPDIDLDFQQDIEQNIDIPTGMTLPREQYDIPAEEIQAYLDSRSPKGPKNPKGLGRTLRRAADIIEDVIEWLIALIGLRAFKILAGLGLGLLAIYTMYKMSQWLYDWIKSDKGQEELEKAKKESLDEKQIWGRTGKRVVRKYRCSGGRRHGRVVSKMSQCFAPLNFKQSARFKRLKKAIGTRMTRKAKRTKRVNPASRRLAQLNKRR